MTADLGGKLVRVFLAWPGVTLLPEGGGRNDFAQVVWKAEHKGFSDEQTWVWRRQSLVEASALASDFGVTLALQNHPAVIKGYADTIRMAKEVASPNLKICFDARLEHSLDEASGPQRRQRSRRDAGAVAFRLVRPGRGRNHGQGLRQGAGGGARSLRHRLPGLRPLRAMPPAAGRKTARRWAWISWTRTPSSPPSTCAAFWLMPRSSTPLTAEIIILKRHVFLATVVVFGSLGITGRPCPPHVTRQKRQRK
jgi:hypothetical protein